MANSAIHRMISLCGRKQLRDGSAQLIVVAHVSSSSSYKLALGPSHLGDLHRLRVSLGGASETFEATSKTAHRATTANGDTEDMYAVTKEPPPKKTKLTLIDDDDRTPVRVICSARFLEHVRHLF